MRHKYSKSLFENLRAGVVIHSCLYIALLLNEQDFEHAGVSCLFQIISRILVINLKNILLDFNFLCCV